MFLQDIAINVPKQENEDILGEDGSQIPHVKEDTACKASDNELGNTLEDKFEDKSSLEAELVENEKSTEKASVKEDVPIESIYVADKDIKVFASRQERETSFLEEQSLPANPEGIISHHMEGKADDATRTVETREDEVSIMLIDKICNHMLT